MKNTMISMILMVSTSTFAAQHSTRVPQLKVTSVFNHPVIAQTKAEIKKETSRATFMRKLYITRWGTQRFEVGYADYKCTASKCALINEPKALQFFESCTGFSKSKIPLCEGLVASSDEVSSTDGTTHVLVPDENRLPWYACEDYDAPCDDRDLDNGFPVRITPQDPAF